MTADGKITTANRIVSSFGSRRDQIHLLELRAQADAVMVGARTADANPINLGPGPARYRRWRLKHGLAEYNLRILVSGSASVNPAAVVFRHHFSPIVILTTARALRSQVARLKRRVDAVMVCGERQIDFGTALRRLRREWGVKRLLCEGGGELNGALFRAGLVDELHVTVCPRIFGGRQAATIVEGEGVDRLGDAIRLELESAKRVGGEMYLVYRIL